MYLIKPGINIDFVGKRNIAFVVSLSLILLCIVTLIIHKGPKLGVDFAGGTQIQVKFSKSVQIDDIKKGLRDINIHKSQVQRFGDAKENEYLIDASQQINSQEESTEEFETAMENALLKSTGVKPDIRRVEMVGPQVGKDLREKALFAMFYVLLLITIYISGRFEFKWMVSAVMTVAIIGAVYILNLLSMSIPILILAALIVSLILSWVLELKYAMGAIVALIHDVTITVGIFSLLGKEFTIPIIAALLTIIGYSLNDTIIVYDRIRENLKKNTKTDLKTNINKSINETLSRTILTSFTTLLVLIVLFLLGGGIIHDFAFAMLVGIVVGTYSSVYVASPILIVAQRGKSAAAK